MASFSTLALAVLVVSLYSDAFGASAQNCYYPDGTVAEGDAACSSDGGMCCPLNWECMSNGLCYLPSQDFYGRYTCTDQTWQSSSCPDICIPTGETGNEAVLWCPSGDWCCDGDRSWNCCTTADTKFFSLPKPNLVVSISTVPASATPVSSVSNAPQSSSDGTPASSSQGASSSVSPNGASSRTTVSVFTEPSQKSKPSKTAKSTLTHTSITTGTDGAVSTVYVRTTESSAPSEVAATNGHSSSHSGSNIGMIVGLALGVAIVLVLCGISTFCLCRRRRKSKQYSNVQRPGSPPMEANYSNIAPGSHAPELDSYPVAPTRTKSNKKSELYGSDVQNSPALSVGSNGTAPPQYSPGGRTPVTPTMAQIQEEPQELWGGYVPYRPGRTELPSERNSEKSNSS